VLKREKDFARYCNRMIRVKTLDPIENRRHFKGRLQAVSEGRIEIEVDGKTFQIPLSNIAKANLEIEF